MRSASVLGAAGGDVAATRLIKPTRDGLDDPEMALQIALRMFEAIVALQQEVGVEDIADRNGKSEFVVIRNANVSTPGSDEVFVADVYGVAVRVA